MVNCLKVKVTENDSLKLNQQGGTYKDAKNECFLKAEKDERP